MNYLSLDIETTGLNTDKSQVLEIGAVLVRPGQEDLTFHVIVDHGEITYGEPYALAMNARLFKAISESMAKTTGAAQFEWREFLQRCLRATGEKRLTVAGKNAAGFDVPILRNNGFDTKQFAHRVIDVGSLYLPDFGHMPTLSEVNTITGGNIVTHEALQDAYDVVRAVNYKLSRQQEAKQEAKSA